MTQSVKSLLERAAGTEPNVADHLRAAAGPRPEDYLPPTINVYEGIADPNDVKVKAVEVQDMAVDLDLPIETVELNFEPIKLITNAVPDPDDIDVEKLEVPSEKEVQPVMEAAEPKKTFLEQILGFKYPAHPPNWDNASPIEKFSFATLPIADFLGRIGGKIASDWRISSKEENQKLLAGIYKEELEWYQKSPELIGWSAEKVAEYLALKTVFKAAGLHRVLTEAGEKAATPFIKRALVAKGGIQALKTLSPAGLRNLMRQSLITFLRAAPENITFISSWSALDSVIKGQSVKEVGIAAAKGAGWGAGLTAGMAVLAPIARAPEVKLIFSRAMRSLTKKYPKTVDLLGKDIPKEIEKEWMKQYRVHTGHDVRLIDLTKTQRASFRNAIRAAEKELLKAAKVEQAIRTYWSTEARMAKEAGAAAKATGIKETALAKQPPLEPIKPPQPAPVVPKPEITPKPAPEGGVEEAQRLFDVQNKAVDEIALSLGEIYGRNPADRKEQISAELLNDAIVAIRTMKSPTGKYGKQRTVEEVRDILNKVKARTEKGFIAVEKKAGGRGAGPVQEKPPPRSHRIAHQLHRIAIDIEHSSTFKSLAPAPAKPVKVGEKLIEPKKVEPKPLKKAVTVSGKKFHPQTLPVESIGVDAEKFQFKLGARLEGGVTDALKAVEKFDPIKGGTILVWQDKAGKHWVIDGHHRVALARKTGQETMDAWVVREEDGWTASDARAVGALRNLADGKGTAVDAAKLFRDSDISLQQLRKEGVPTESTIVQQGLQMKNLSNQVFKMVVNERLAPNMAAVIGKNVKGDASQKQVADLILEGEVDTVRQAELLSMTIDSAPVLKKSEMTLFGLETTEKSLYAERAKVLANVEKKLKTNKKVFGTLAKQAGLIESKGNVLDKIQNMQTKELAEEVLYMLEKFANAKGEVSEALNDATKEYAKNPTRENLTRVTNDLVQKWTKATTGLTLQNVKGLFGTPAKRAEEAVEKPDIKGKVEQRKHFTDLLLDERQRILDEAKEFSEQFNIETLKKDYGQKIADIDRDLRKRGFNPTSLPSLAENIKGKAGFVNVEPVEKAFTAFMNLVEPSKAVEITQGKDVYATVIRGIHKPDVARIEYNERELDNLDGNLREFGEKLAKYSDKILTNLMLSRGKPASANAIMIQEEARKALVEEAPELVGLQKMITRISDANYKFLQDVVGDKISYVEDYFYGIYKNPKKVERFLDYWKTTKRFTKQKKLPTVADAMDYGLELRDPNPVNNLRSEYMAISRLDGMIWMRDELMRTGEDKYISKNPDVIADAEKIPEPVFKGLWFEPDLARMIKSLISANKVQQHWALNTLRKVNNFLRSVKFLFSGFHHLAEAKQALADSGYLGFGYKKTATRGLRVPFLGGFKKGDPVFQTTEYKDYIEHGGGHRYSIDSQAERAFVKIIENLTKSSKLVVKGAIAPLRIPTAYVKWLFESYIPKVKYTKYLDAVNEKSKKLGRELTSAEKIDIIKEGQNFYGMMNERLFGRSGTVTSAMRFKFMAPGFAEGNYRTILKAILQWGQGESFSAGRSRADIVNALLITAIAGTLGTLIMTGKPPKKPETAKDIRDLFKIDTGKFDAKGRKIMFDLMSFDKDYWAIFGKPLVGQAGEVPVDVIRRLGGMTATTWDVISDLNQMSMGHAIYDWKGNRVVEVTDPFARRVLALAIHETKKAQPISTNVYWQARDKGLDRLTAGIATLLGVRPTTSEKDKRESAIISKIFSLRDKQERLYYFLGSIKEPRKKIDQYNKTAQGIMDNPVVTEDMRKKWGKNIIIDTDRLMANKVHAHELLKVTEKPKPDELEKTGKWLKNFGITESQYRKHLIVYEMKHRKLIIEMKAGDADELLKDEIAKFYADKGIVDRKVRGGTATDAEKRLARKYSVLSGNISEIGTRIHKSNDIGHRKNYYDRIRRAIERI